MQVANVIEAGLVAQGHLDDFADCSGIKCLFSGHGWQHSDMAGKMLHKPAMSIDVPALRHSSRH